MSFFFSCIAALLGAQVILTDLPDRLKLLRKNVETNLYGHVKGSATVQELSWGDDPEPDITDPLPDYGKIFPYQPWECRIANDSVLVSFSVLYIGNLELANTCKTLQYYYDKADMDTILGG